MSKTEFVAAAKAKFVEAEDAAAQTYGEECFQGGADEQAAADGSVTQGQVDELNKQVDDLKVQLEASQAQDAVDAKTAADALAQVGSLSATIESLNSQIADVSSRLGADEKIIGQLKGSLAQIQAVEAALLALIPQPETPVEA